MATFANLNYMNVSNNTNNNITNIIEKQLCIK